MAAHTDVIVSVVFLLSALPITLQKSTTTSPTYVAAVVEYVPAWTPNTEYGVLINKSLADYQRYIKDAAAKDADIIVLPGYALSTLLVPSSSKINKELLTELPDPKDLVNPCLENHVNVSETIKTLSCAARASSIYVVNFVLEVDICDKHVSECSESEVYYGTSLVFDRSGTITAKYRGSDIIGEPLLTKPSPPVTSVFDTDFGVRFGMLSGVGIVSHVPAFRLMREYHVTDFVYTTLWLSELPFFTNLQIQAGWSRANNVNLLAASRSEGRYSYGGSGIYSGRSGTRASHISTNSSFMMVAHVYKIDFVCEELGACPAPKPESEAALSIVPIHKGFVAQKENLKIYRTLSLSNFYEYSGNIGSVDRNITLCHWTLCCSYYIKMHTKITPPIFKHGDMKSNGYLYRLATFDGVKTLRGMASHGVQICAIMACTGTRLSTCGMVTDVGKPQNIKTVFEKVVIQGNFTLEFANQMPTALDEKLRILPYKSYVFRKRIKASDNMTRISMYNTRDLTLYTFGIFGRKFERDGLPATFEEIVGD